MKIFSIKDAAAFLLGSDGYLIYTHASPDGDTLGSAVALCLALKALGKKVNIFSVDGIPEKLNFLPTDGLFTQAEPEIANGLIPISVDVAGPRMLGKCKNTHFAMSIDHHKVNTIECDNLLVMADRVACGEIIAEIIFEMGVPLTKDIAVAVYTAICSDSGGFKYDATTAKTYTLAAKCLEAGIDFAEINRRLFESKTKSQIALIKAAYNNLQLLREGRFAIVAIPPEEAEACGALDVDFEAINSIPREIKGVLASAIIRQKADGVKVSMRSNVDIDVSELAKANGGGGHYHAAGFSMDCDFHKAVARVREIFEGLEI